MVFRIKLTRVSKEKKDTTKAKNILQEKQSSYKKYEEHFNQITVCLFLKIQNYKLK